MASGALFGGQAGRSTSKNLVEFRAGKMHMKGKMVHPDKRKGMVYVYQSDDSLMHFCWKDRSKGTAEDDLIIFPEDVEFKAVPQCTTGRVFLLKFKASTRKMFFWMQEPKSDKDEEHCKKVNESLNNPPSPGSARAGGSSSAGGGLGELAAGLGGGSDIQNLLSNMSQQELMQLLGGMGVGGLGGLSALMGQGGRSASAASESTPPSRVQSSPGPRTTTAESNPPATQPRPVTAAVLPSQATESADSGGDKDGSGTDRSGIQLSDLQTILGSMGVRADAKDPVDISKAVTPEAIIPLLANGEIQTRLLEFLPEGENLPRTEAELRNTVSSPQFTQAMNSFSAALASGQLGPLMGQFDLGEDVANAAAQGDVEAFAKALQANYNKKEEGKEKEKDASQDADVEMKEDTKE